MNAAKIKCRDLMVGDWITNRNEFPMQITNVGEDYAYATFEGNDGGLSNLMTRMTSHSLFHLLPKFLRKMDGKMTDFGTNI